MNEFLAQAAYLQSNRSGTTATGMDQSTNGSKTFTTAAGLDLQVAGELLYIYLESDTSIYMYGNITAYNSGTGVCTVNITGRGNPLVGTNYNWTIRQYSYIRASTAGYVTAPSDTPASTHWAGRLINPGTVTRSMFAAGATRGGSEVGNATLTLINNDGAYDAVSAHAFDGFALQLMMGEAGGAYSAFTSTSAPLGQYFFGMSEQLVYNDAGDASTLTLSARDMLHKFDVPLQATKFAGTATPSTGIEGTADDLAGKPKPVCMGICRNITPVLCNAGLNAYMVAGSGLNTGFTITVYDSHVSTGITRGADYANLAALEAAAPAAGQYRVWPAGGVFRLGFTPVGQITADVTNPWSGGGPAPNSLAYLVSGLLTEAGKSSTVTVDLAAYPDCGVYVTEEANLLSVLNRLVSSVNASMYADRFGSLYVHQLHVPTGTPDVTITEGQVLQIARRVSADTTRGIPAWRVNLKYRRNHTIQTQQQLTGSATAADIAFCAEEYRTVTWEDATIKRQWPLSPEINVTTLIDTAAAAQSEVNRLGTIHGVLRDMLQVTLALTDDTSGLDLNKTVSLTHSRYGLSGGKLFSVLGYELQAPSAPGQTGTITLTLFG